MSQYPDYTLRQFAELVMKLDANEGLSKAALGTLQEFAASALENDAKQSQAAGAPQVERNSAGVVVCRVCGTGLDAE